MTSTVRDPRRFPFPPAIPIVCLLLGWGIGALRPIDFTWPAWTRPVGWVLFVAPFALAVSAVATFRRRGTVVDPRGDVTTIVGEGPYRFTRNPMYLALVVMYIGGTLAFRLPWAAVLFPAVFVSLHFGVILPEERHLHSKFGESYRAYQRRVRRWL